MTAFPLRAAVLALTVLSMCLLSDGEAVGLELLSDGERSAARPPNVVIIFADDQGYADVGCFGAQGFQTPHLDQLAADGVRLTNFVVAQAVCGASRAALLTGCYPNRIGMLGAPSHQSTHGINSEEMLLSEVCQQRGYATACYGKWHLGHHQPFLPLQHGFDEYFGLPYSNDMWPYHPERPAGHPNAFPDLPLISGNDIVNPRVTPEDQVHLTTWYTEHAVDFIHRHHDRPFFLYVPHAMPHVPLFVSEKFRGQSERGVYGDVIMEIDWCVGEIVNALREHELERDTLVIYTSDNGPWLSYGDHAGSAGPLREGKGTMWEGGVREPCIMRWTGHIPAGSTCDEFAASIDIVPTIAGLIGAELPSHPIDGLNIWPLLSGRPDVTTPHDAYFYYWGRELQAVRSADWKLHLPHSYRTLNGRPGGTGGIPVKYSEAHTDWALYNLRDDIGEQHNVLTEHPEIVERLKRLVEQARADLGDSATRQEGRGLRPAGKLAP